MAKDKKQLTFFKKIVDKPCILRYYFIVSFMKLSGCSAVGSVRGLGPWGREFEPLHPDHKILGLTTFWAFSSVG